MASKSKIRSMQRGAHKTDRERITSDEIYRKHPPKFSKSDIPHFHFGNVDYEKTIKKTELVLVSAIARKLTASELAKILNIRNIRTACGDRWTPRLAWFLKWIYADYRRSLSKGTRQTAPKNSASKVKLQQVQKSTRRSDIAKIKIGEKHPELGALLKSLKEES